MRDEHGRIFEFCADCGAKTGRLEAVLDNSLEYILVCVDKEECDETRDRARFVAIALRD